MPEKKSASELPKISEERVDLHYEETVDDLITQNVKPALLFVDASQRRVGVRDPDGKPGEYFVDLDSLLRLLRKCAL